MSTLINNITEMNINNGINIHISAHPGCTNKSSESVRTYSEQKWETEKENEKIMNGEMQKNRNHCTNVLSLRASVIPLNPAENPARGGRRGITL